MKKRRIGRYSSVRIGALKASRIFYSYLLPPLIFPTIFPVNTAGSRSTEHKLCLILQREERKKEVWQNKGMEYTHTWYLGIRLNGIA